MQQRGNQPPAKLQLGITNSQQVQYLGENKNMDHKQWSVPIYGCANNLRGKIEPLGRLDVPRNLQRRVRSCCNCIVRDVLWSHVQMGENIETQQKDIESPD